MKKKMKTIIVRKQWRHREVELWEMEEEDEEEKQIVKI